VTQFTELPLHYRLLSVVFLIVLAVGCSPKENSTQGVYKIESGPSVSLVNPIWSPEGNRLTASHIAYQDNKSTIYNFDLQTREFTPLISIDGEAVAQSWSSDGATLAISVSGSTSLPKDGVWIFNVSGGSPSYIGSGEAAVWSPRGNSLAVYSCEYGSSGIATVRIIDLSQKEEQIIFSHRNCFKLAYMTWSADGENIALSFGEGKLSQNPVDRTFVVNTSARKVTQILGEGNWSPSFSPDSDAIVIVNNYKLAISDKAGHCQIDVKDLGIDTVGEVSWSPDGKKWAVSGLGKTYIIDIEEALGQNFFQSSSMCP